ncbi:unnamed protein product, partial [Allacma fusca]
NHQEDSWRSITAVETRACFRRYKFDSIALIASQLEQGSGSQLFEMLAKIFFTVFLTVGVTSGQVVRHGESAILEAFLEAVPIYPQIRTPDIPAPLNNPPKIINNEVYINNYNPTSACASNQTDLALGEVGTITSPNYPENYPGGQLCQWYLESIPGTRIEATFFDLVTQPWFFTYFDYLMISKSGNFSKVDRVAGDMNGKTPMTVSSEANKFGLRFRSSSLFNFRGFRMQYIVVPEDPVAAQLIEVSPYSDGCGLSPVLEAEASATSPGPITIPIEPVDASSTDAPNVPILTPGNGNEVKYVQVPASPWEFDSKIIGQSPAPKHGYPWMVALLIDGRHFCGGSIIDAQHVLTAAHCTDNAKTISMLFGSHNIRAPKASEPSRVIVNVTDDDIHQHPKYNPNTIANDISIIRLPQRLQFNDEIRPVCLPNKYFLSRTFVGDRVRVTGWGKNSDKAASITPELQQAGVSVMPNGQCRNYFRGIVTGNLICVQTTRTVSPCKGDSGGPLVVEQQGRDGPYFLQLGIVSFGSYTCERAFPVGFTRTTAFLDFIGNVTGRALL